MTEMESAVVATEIGAVSHSSAPVAIKQKAILHAAIGHLIPVMIGLPLVLKQRIAVTIDEWILTFLVVVLVWSFLWLVLRLGWDRALTFDPHFLFVPAGVGALLIGLYILLVPEARLLLLHGWYAVLLFGAGFLGLRSAVVLNTMMVATYLGVVWYLINRGEPLFWGFEVSAAATFYAMCFFCAILLERLRRDRREMKSLRRQMFQLALTDRLTGLPNRRHLEEALARQASHSRRTGAAYSLALVDVDRFKEINDTYRHEAGDRVLVGLSKVFRRVLRETDLVGRIGGDEFAILMPEAGLDEAARVVERVRGEVQNCGYWRSHLHRHKVTVSIGVVEAGSDEFPADVLNRADERLYVAKRCGRNRVEMWSLGSAVDDFSTIALAGS